MKKLKRCPLCSSRESEKVHKYCFHCKKCSFIQCYYSDSELRDLILDSRDFREKLALLCHKQWSGWMKYLFSKCYCNFRRVGEQIIPATSVERWRRQMNTPYNKLSKEEKNSDRKEADRFIRLIKELK